MSPQRSPKDDAEATRKCPACGKRIPAEAMTCRFCRERLGAPRVSVGGSRGGSVGPWRDGSLVVVRTGGKLPLRCVKRDAPVERLAKIELSYVPAWVILVLFLGSPCLWLLVGLILQQKVPLAFGLSAAARTVLRVHAVVTYVLAFSGLGAIGWFVARTATATPTRQPSFWWGVAGLILFVVGAFYGTVQVPVLKVRRLQGDLAWLSGACPAFLARLPRYEG